ncbi:cupredoxin domain-containing protein [Nocardioides sambongensis]|uniref:hypothetical protein n=1 Tax=Nocardioides sambongensis TaxID=2589074 RepID=UPI001125C42E|nr:hypothetical protein [Nocardioides sambongensis]
MGRRLVGAAGALLLIGTMAGCGGDEEAAGSDEPVVVEITFADGGVTPVGDRVEVQVGEPVDLEVTADEAGELHVHSDPEQELAFDAGTETFEIEIPRPGRVDIESHDLDQVIVTLIAQ